MKELGQKKERKENAEAEEAHEHKHGSSKEPAQLGKQSKGHKPTQMIGEERKAEASKRDEGPRGSESSGTRGRIRSRDNKNERSSAGEKELAQREENKSGSVATLSGKADEKRSWGKQQQRADPARQAERRKQTDADGRQR